jgi:predicted nucleotidyltransferase
MIPDEVFEAARNHPHPLLFATVSGAHLYGFDSSDSDWDLRGAHVLPLQQTLGLMPQQETIELSQQNGIELDLVTHDVKKFFTLLLRPNGYVLEQLLSPITVQSSPEHEELKALVPNCLTKHHAHHYLGFAENQWKLFSQEQQPRIKPLLYTFRALLTGIHLMRSGEIQANLNTLLDTYPLPFLKDLIAMKRQGTEKQLLNATDLAFYEAEFSNLRERLTTAAANTNLANQPSAQRDLNDLLIRIRLKEMAPSPRQQPSSNDPPSTRTPR